MPPWLSHIAIISPPRWYNSQHSTMESSPHPQRNVWCRKCRHEGGAGNHHYLKLVLKYNLPLGFTCKQYKYSSKYKNKIPVINITRCTQCITASAQKNRAAVWSQKSLQFSSQMCKCAQLCTVVQSANQNRNTNFPCRTQLGYFFQWMYYCSLPLGYWWYNIIGVLYPSILGALNITMLYADIMW